METGRRVVTLEIIANTRHEEIRHNERNGQQSITSARQFKVNGSTRE